MTTTAEGVKRMRPRPLAFVMAVAAVLFSFVPAARIPEPVAAGADLQDGDFLVGNTVTGGFGHVEGQLVRVRGGVATEFCAPVTSNAGEPGFWNTPSDVLIDSQGRVVFLAYLAGADGTLYRGFGLWRCDAMGATPTMLGAFGSPANNPVLALYPRPLGDRDIRTVGGLHLKRSKGVDLNTGTMAESQLYVFAVSDISGDRGHADTIAYNPATGDWIESFEDPVPTDQYGNTTDIDMINANGYTFSVAGACLRGFAEPVSLDFQVGEFSGGLAFQSLHDLCNVGVDDSATANSPSGCPPHSDGVSLSNPTNAGGTYNVMTGYFQLAWNDALVLQTRSGAAGHAFTSNVSLTLFDLIPANDTSAMYHGAFCDHEKKLDYTPWHPAEFSWNDSGGTPRSVTRMTPDGRFGTQGYPYYRIVSVGPSQEVSILAEEGLINPVGIDVYPGFTPPLNGITFFVKIDSPVDVLITDPDGRSIGVDPATGLFVNDFGDAGYDSNTDEPHIYGIRDPMPGDYTIQTAGTGTGPYTITTYGANLGTSVIDNVQFTGNATPGSSSSHEAGLTTDGAVTNEDVDTTAPTDPTLGSSSHTISTWSTDRTVEVTLTGASDAGSGVDGFSYAWDTSPSTLPDQTKDDEATVTGTTSPPLAEGNSHWFHLRTVDNAGNWTSTAHIGPFWIDQPFTDIDASGFYDEIWWLQNEAITLGCNPPTQDRFCPTDTVSRQQMASFLARAKDLDTTTNDYFVDDEGSPHEGDINRLRFANITNGCNPPTQDRFCPTGIVSRQEMASFIARAMALPTTETDYFTDDTGSPHEADINRMREANITNGCNPPDLDRYCPTNPVTREQMAAFLYRALTGD